MTVQVFQKPETVPIWCEDKDWQGTYIDPSQGILVTIYKPDGSKAVDDQPMTKSETGKYVYYYNTATDSPVGWWRYSCKAVDGAGETAKTVIVQGAFEVK